MKNTNYAFLGMMIPESDYVDVLKNSMHSMQDAANTFQWHLYDGLCQNLNYPIHLINVLPIYSWPSFYKKIWIHHKRFNTKYSEDNENLGFLNVRFIRKKFITRSVYCSLIKWCKSYSGKKKLFIYTLSGTLMNAVSKVKFLYPELEVCVIIADLPNMCNLSINSDLFTKIISRKHSLRTYCFDNSIDYYVLLTKYMADYMKNDKPFCVVEGIATNSEEFIYDKTLDFNRKIVMYSGTLHQRFGVLNLVEAFRNIKDKNYQLVLCGVGDCEEKINKAVNEDSRICFLGQIPHEEVLSLQKRATVLVNPRQNVEKFTKYSFPSKNLEYLSSGVPMIGYKLDGIPDEYDKHIFYVKDNSVKSLTDKIISVCELDFDERCAHGYKAKEFVRREKNEYVQTKKIIEMINK